MNALIEKIRRAREFGGIEAGGHTFTIRRPTDEEALTLARQNTGLVDVVRQFTIDWDLTELDLIPGGSAEPVPFDAALFAEWVVDQPDVWEPLGNAVMAEYARHAARREEALKN